MSPNLTQKQIVFVGRRNVGKSSLLNVFLGQNLSIVGDLPGTTTDPVWNTVELLPYGPALLIDTAGIDDSGELGNKRISKKDNKNHFKLFSKCQKWFKLNIFSCI